MRFSEQASSSTVTVVKSPAVHRPMARQDTSRASLEPGSGNGFRTSRVDAHSAVDNEELSSPRLPAGLHVSHGRRRSSTGSHGRHEPNEPATAWFDAPLALALAPTVGSFVTGGEHIRDFLLLLIMLFYLHQLIKVPWDLYMMSRPRRHGIHRPHDDKSEVPRTVQLAQSELHSLSMLYLALTIISPLIGAYLLRTISASLLGQDYISWFSTVVFVLAAGIRPWRHLITLLRTRTLELQDAAHEDDQSISPDRRSLLARVELLEEQLAAEVAESVAARADMERLKQSLEQSYEELEKLIRRVSRKNEAERSGQSHRLDMLEAKVESLTAKNSGPALYPAVPSLLPTFFSTFWNSGTANSSGAVKSRKSVKHRTHKRVQPLTRIPEDGELVLPDDGEVEDEDEPPEWFERTMRIAFAPVRTLRLLLLYLVQMIRSVFFS